MKIYGTPNPPEYNISNINVKFQMFYGTNDLVQTKEVSLYYRKIQSSQI